MLKRKWNRKDLDFQQEPIQIIGEDLIGQIGRAVFGQPEEEPGRLHVKLLSHQNFFEIGFIPGGEQAFVLDADLLRGFVLEQA